VEAYEDPAGPGSKGVGRVYQQTLIDTYAKVAFAKLYDRKTPITAADLLNDRVISFFDSHDVKLMRVLTDRGSEYCGNPERHRPGKRARLLWSWRVEAPGETYSKHLIVLGERHLLHLLRCYASYYNRSRTHLSLNKDAPTRRPVHTLGSIEARPVLGGLHHHYVRI